MKVFFLTLLILYLVYKLIGFAFRMLFRIVGGRMVQNAKEYQAQQHQSAQKREGEVRIEYVPDASKSNGNGSVRKSSSHDGEYVDYEEVK